jgi:hypothetical protein
VILRSKPGLVEGFTDNFVSTSPDRLLAEFGRIPRRSDQNDAAVIAVAVFFVAANALYQLYPAFGRQVGIDDDHPGLKIDELFHRFMNIGATANGEAVQL